MPLRMCADNGDLLAPGRFIAAAERYHLASRSVPSTSRGSRLPSYAWLRNLPVHMLKIDGQFVRDIAHDPVSLAMVTSIHEIACLMGKKTVAGFVETPAILELLLA